MHPNDRLKHHVTGAIERGEATAITAVVVPIVTNHSYHCEEGCYYHAGCHQTYESWQQFLESEWAPGTEAFDIDLNRIHRFDITNEYGTPELRLYYILQRKAAPFSVYVTVSESDYSAIKAFLKPYADYEAALWAEVR